MIIFVPDHMTHPFLLVKKTLLYLIKMSENQLSPRKVIWPFLPFFNNSRRLTLKIFYQQDRKGSQQKWSIDKNNILFEPDWDSNKQNINQVCENISFDTDKV